VSEVRGNGDIPPWPRVLLDAEQSYHQRYLELFRRLGERDDELGKTFAVAGC
jgi:hypothetical protein